MGDTPTFRNQNGTSIIDLTLATPTLAAKITEWEVMDTISLSDHSYILFKINTSPTANQKLPTRSTRKVSCQKLEETLKKKEPSIDTGNMNPEDLAKNYYHIHIRHVQRNNAITSIEQPQKTRILVDNRNQ